MISEKDKQIIKTLYVAAALASNPEDSEARLNEIRKMVGAKDLMGVKGLEVIRMEAAIEAINSSLAARGVKKRFVAIIPATGQIIKEGSTTVH